MKEFIMEIQGSKTKFFLYHYEKNGQGHFDVLTEVNQLMCTSYYCDECDKGFKMLVNISVVNGVTSVEGNVTKV